MKNKMIVIYPEDRELNRLRDEGLLDERGRPISLTHFVTSEMSDRSHMIQIYDNVFLSPLHASREDSVVIFDRHGHAFEISPSDIEEMGVDVRTCPV
jgi:hypothetical protein